jgi:hypothetical protein
MIKSGVAAPGFTGGSSVIPNLQQVTDAGNTTSDDIISAKAGNSVDISGEGGFVTMVLGSAQGLFAPDDVVLYGNAGYWIELYSSATSQLLVYRYNTFRNRIGQLPITADQNTFFPAKGGTIVVQPDIPVGTLTFNTVIGAGSYDIPHGLGVVPTFASITAKDGSAGKLVAGGYWLTYDATNIVLNLVVITTTVNSVTFDWFARTP